MNTHYLNTMYAMYRNSVAVYSHENKKNTTNMDRLHSSDTMSCKFWFTRKINLHLRCNWRNSFVVWNSTGYSALILFVLTMCYRYIKRIESYLIWRINVHGYDFRKKPNRSQLQQLNVLTFRFYFDPDQMSLHQWLVLRSVMIRIHVHHLHPNLQWLVIVHRATDSSRIKLTYLIFLCIATIFQEKK